MNETINKLSNCLLRTLPWLLCSVAWSQGLQNKDVCALVGPIHSSAQLIGDPPVQLSASRGYSFIAVYGYQIRRKAAASLWIEISPTQGSREIPRASVPSSVSYNMTILPLGIRLMVPIHSRVSLYGLVGGGVGFFQRPWVTEGSNPLIHSVPVTHGVFQYGGGVDVRLARIFSIRAEARDFVTGVGLSGSTGRNHLLPSAGVAFHF